MDSIEQRGDNAVQILVGEVVKAEGGPHGDYVLHYADGRIVHIDCGYVGATIYLAQYGPKQLRKGRFDVSWHVELP